MFGKRNFKAAFKLRGRGCSLLSGRSTVKQRGKAEDGRFGWESAGHKTCGSIKEIRAVKGTSPVLHWKR